MLKGDNVILRGIAAKICRTLAVQQRPPGRTGRRRRPPMPQAIERLIADFERETAKWRAGWRDLRDRSGWSLHRRLRLAQSERD